MKVKLSSSKHSPKINANLPVRHPDPLSFRTTYDCSGSSSCDKIKRVSSWCTTIYDGHGRLSRCSELQTPHRSTVYDSFGKGNLPRNRLLPAGRDDLRQGSPEADAVVI